MPRNGIPGSNFLRKGQTDFQSDFTSLQSHEQWRRVCLSSHPQQHLLSPEFLILVILTGVRWNLSVVLICISLMTKDVEHFFMCFSAIRYSSVENSLFSLELLFVLGLFGSLESNLLGSLYILDISTVSVEQLVKIFSSSVGGHLVLLKVSFSIEKGYNFMSNFMSILDLRA